MDKKGMLASAFALCVVSLGLAFAITPINMVYANTTTTTVVGWLVPDGTHWNNGIGAFLFPIVGVGLFAGMAKVLGLEGEFGVTLILAGLTIGGVLAQLSINASNTNVIPFALIVIPGLDLILWMWRGQG